MATLKSTRESFKTEAIIAVPYFTATTQQQEYINTVYKDTGKIVSQDVDLSINGLSQTINTVWLNDVVLEEFNTDPIIIQYHADRATYNDQQGIMSVVSVYYE
jgi:hypothetical protein